MTIEIRDEVVAELVGERMRAGGYQSAEELLQDLLGVPVAAETRTGADLIAAMQACPWPEVEIGGSEDGSGRAPGA